METETNKRVSRERFELACRENETIEALCGVLGISELGAYRLEKLYDIGLPEKERPGNIHIG